LSSSNSDSFPFDYSSILSQNKSSFYIPSSYQTSSSIFSFNCKAETSIYSRQSQSPSFSSYHDIIMKGTECVNGDDDEEKEDDKERNNNSSPILGVDFTIKEQSSNSFSHKQPQINLNKNITNTIHPIYFPPHPLNSEIKHLYNQNSTNFNFCVSIPPNFTFPSFLNPLNNIENSNNTNNAPISPGITSTFLSSNSSVCDSSNNITDTVNVNSTPSDGIRNFRNKRNKTMSEVFICSCLFIFFIFIFTSILFCT
jgi:hypothetical protein